MKKKKLQPQMPSTLNMQVRFLTEMIDVYNGEQDIFEREKMRQCVSEYILSNRLVTEIFEYDGEDSQNKNKVIQFLEDEEVDFNKKLSKYKIKFEDLALVSVKCDFGDKLSPITNQELKRNKSCLPEISKKFEKGEIWEYAILSKDKKSFILLRDFLDNKIQPIENCEIWRNSSISQLHKKDEKHGIIKISEVPPSVYWVDDACKFTDREIHRGVFVENLFEKNIDCIIKQMEREIHKRTVWYEEKQKMQKENDLYNARPTFEF